MDVNITGASIYDYVDSKTGIEKEKMIIRLSKIIDKSRSAVYNKLRLLSFSLPERRIIYYELNGVMGSEFQVTEFFEK